MLKHTILSLSLLALVGFGCGTGDPDAKWQEHDSVSGGQNDNPGKADNAALSSNGDPILPWMWHELSYEEFVSMNPGPPAVDKSQPIAQRLQYWADVLFQLVQERAPDLVRYIPRPEVALLIDPVIEGKAFAMTVGDSILYPLVVSLPEHEGQEQIFALSFQPSGIEGNDQRILRRQTECSVSEPCQVAKPAVMGNLSLPDFTAWLNTANDDSPFGNPCVFEHDGTSIILKSENCRQIRADDLVNVSAAQNFVIGAVSDLIVIGSSMVEFATEERMMVAIVAHEFGHVLKAHMAQLDLARRYGYPYDESNDETRLNRPQYDPAGSGVYTYEQEADEFIPELMALLGLDVSGLVQMHLAVLKKRTELNLLKPGETNYGDCLSLIEQNWTDGSGTKVKPPIGDLRNPHHSICYRIWNVSNANVARRPEINTAISHPSVDWAALRRDHLDALSTASPIMPIWGFSCPAGTVCEDW
jgi:hypothetical protein